MLTSRLTQKGQTTIPALIRQMLSLTPGDNVSFSIDNGKVMLSKVNNFDIAYAKAVESSLSSEWDSEADNKAYNDL